jgi:hypothetical protein
MKRKEKMEAKSSQDPFQNQPKETVQLPSTQQHRLHLKMDSQKSCTTAKAIGLQADPE